MEILNSKQIDSKIENLAREILNQHIDNIAIVGIQKKGVVVAKRLSKKIQSIQKTTEDIPFGIRVRGRHDISDIHTDLRLSLLRV